MQEANTQPPASQADIDDIFADEHEPVQGDAEVAAPQQDDAEEIHAVIQEIEQSLDLPAVQQDLFDSIWDDDIPAADVPAPSSAVQPVPAPPSSAAQPSSKQGGLGGPRLYSSPVCLNQLCGPHGIIRLDCNAHRFIAECGIGYPGMLVDKRPYHFKTSGQLFTTAGTWQKSLIYAHTWLWTKYTLLPEASRPSMPAGTLPQTPGEIPQSVLDDLASNTIPSLPDAPKKYNNM